MFILGLNLLPKVDRENKLRILNRDEILLKKSNAGAKATGKKFSFPENIKKNPITYITKMISYIKEYNNVQINRKLFSYCCFDFGRDHPFAISKKRNCKPERQLQPNYCRGQILFFCLIATFSNLI